ncbi:MAG TPA: PadR family transcriptional regulator [Clostridia bacterium]|nr:PadR family transcriptional regulator [Clostridia bacterium]
MPESNERGALTEAVYFILLALYTPMHGYRIMQTVREQSRGRVDLGAGTLYGAINTLLEKKWIVPVEGAQDSRKKEYEITALGKSVVSAELLRLQELVETGKHVTGGRTL